MATNQGFQSLVVKYNQCGTFLYYLLSFNRALLIEKASGSTFLEIGRRQLESIKLHLPPLPEQQAIAEVLTALDDELRALDERRGKTQHLKRGMMASLLSGKVRLR